MATGYRVLVWLDTLGQPLQVAVAQYEDDVKEWERTWEADPFESAHSAFQSALRSLDIQQALW